MILTIYTKFGRKISVGATMELARKVVSAFSTDATYSVTLTEEGGQGRSYTIPLKNIDYIEVK